VRRHEQRAGEPATGELGLLELALGTAAPLRAQAEAQHLQLDPVGLALGAPAHMGAEPTGERQLGVARRRPASQPRPRQREVEIGEGERAVRGAECGQLGVELEAAAVDPSGEQPTARVEREALGEDGVAQRRVGAVHGGVGERRVVGRREVAPAEREAVERDRRQTGRALAQGGDRPLQVAGAVVPAPAPVASSSRRTAGGCNVPSGPRTMVERRPETSTRAARKSPWNRRRRSKPTRIRAAARPASSASGSAGTRTSRASRAGPQAKAACTEPTCTGPSESARTRSATAARRPGA
jgi:hypothetical protein